MGTAISEEKESVSDLNAAVRETPGTDEMVSGEQCAECSGVNTGVDSGEERSLATPGVFSDPWAELRRYTMARIGLGRSGVSLPIKPWLDFRLAHARARDAVHMPLQSDMILAGLAANNLPTLHLASSVDSKSDYLTRPDKGRRLSIASREQLNAFMDEHPGYEPDVCVVVSDGLSARAVHQNAVECAALFLEEVRKVGFSTTPVVLVDSGRVAVGDDVAAMLNAKLVVILIGERPGLTAPNSMSAYMTYAPYPGIREEMRNCISNIRPEGYPVPDAVKKLCYLVEKAFAMRLSGTHLKDDMPETYLPFQELHKLQASKHQEIEDK